jgi:hypothetical protein
MPGIEKTPAGRNHFLAVTRIERALLLYRHQVRVILAGHVEMMAAGATPRRAVAK